MPGVEITMVDKSGVVILDLDPATTHKVEPNHDASVVGSLNLAEKGVQAATLAVSGKSGAIDSHNARKGIVQMAGVSRISSERFIDGLGWSVLVRIDPQLRLAKHERTMLLWNVANIAMILALGVFAFAFLTCISGRLVNVVERLTTESAEAQATSATLSSEARQIGESLTRQAAAIEETSSALVEISSKLAAATQQAGDASHSVQDVARRTRDGDQAIGRLQQSIAGIEVAAQELQAIDDIMHEISSRSKVINDIGFETKILSFNASIEVARAGAHGRGFSVVAEEVGKLAATSCAAALEINKTLHTSLERVREIIEKTRERVCSSHSQADSALQTMSEIASAVSRIEAQLKEVSDGAREQEAGVRQISTAAAQFEGATSASMQGSIRLVHIAGDMATRAVSVSTLGSEIGSVIAMTAAGAGEEPQPRADHAPVLEHPGRAKSPGDAERTDSSQHNQLKKAS